MKINPRMIFQLLIVAVIIEKLVAVLFTTPDRAIWFNDYSVNGVTNPEGFLWAILNPIWLGPFKYKVYCFIFDMIMLSLQLRTHKIPVYYLAFHQVFSIYAYTGWGHTWANITIISLMPFMFIEPILFGAITLLQKLPIWFDQYNLSNHIQCALRCAPVHNEGNISTYVMLAMLFLMPLIIRKNVKEEHAIQE